MIDGGTLLILGVAAAALIVFVRSRTVKTSGENMSGVSNLLLSGNKLVASATFGASWTDYSSVLGADGFGGNPLNVFWTGSDFAIGVSGGATDMRYFTSPNGIAWTRQTDFETKATTFITGGVTTLQNAKFAYDKGRNKTYAACDGNGFLVSLDRGVTWTASSALKTLTSGTSADHPGALFAHNGVILYMNYRAGTFRFFVSFDDGASWSNAYEASLSAAVSSTYLSYAVKFFYALGKYHWVGWGPSSRGQTAYSTDGMTWTASNLNAIATGTWNTMYSMATDGHILVAGGGLGHLFYSYDGISWTQGTGLNADVNWAVTTFDSGITALVWTGNKFIAAGWEGRIAYSTDGINWTSQAKTILNNTRSPTWGAALIAASSMDTNGYDTLVVVGVNNFSIGSVGAQKALAITH